MKKVCVWFVLLGLTGSLAQAESLFRASAVYTAQQQGTPPSLFVSPQARQVGDVITVVINEVSTQQTQGELRVNRLQQIDETSTGVMNNAIGTLVNKIPFVGEQVRNTITDKLRLPSFNGIEDQNVLTSQANTLRRNTLQERVACQVVQVLPNGFLMVQGRKTVFMNKEENDLFVTGIINPFYLDRNNEIASSRVGNLQFLSGGRGVLSRPQTDGLTGKLYQIFR
jgi:flagellar L-ring protein precursor FlgH